ncbi:MAG: segregation/condensation protein A [Lachnospiraceae bacterium]|nr:segregation/condensation protein A [Lachnospiraceae bacterium]
MELTVKLQAFEGPLDLLLHLIEKNKVNIYDIPIVEITEQYLDYIREMEKQDLNIVSEFLVMAATLIDIKCKMLLPKEVNDEGEEVDPRAELVEQLLEYKMYKFMAYELKDRQLDAGKSLYKNPTIPEEVLNYVEPVNIEELLSDITLRKLNSIFKTVMKRQEDRIDPIRSQYGNIEKEDVSIEEKIIDVEQFVLEHKEFTFRELLNKQSTKMEIVVTFMVVLEMMKSGKIKILQEETFGEIYITVINEENINGN